MAIGVLAIMRVVSGVQVALLLASSFGASPAQAGRNIQGQIITTLGDDVPIDEPNQFWSQLQHCPQPCNNKDSSEWTVYSSLGEVAICKEPMLFDVNVYSPVSHGRTVKIRACTVSDKKQKTIDTKGAPMKDVFKPSGKKRAEQLSCLGETNKTSHSLQLSRFGSSSSSDNVAKTLESLSKQLEHADNCKLSNSILFAYTNGTIAGAYMGPAVAKSGVAPWIKGISDNMKSQGASQRMVSQLCGPDRNAHHIMGISIDGSGNLDAVQQDLKSWVDGKCVSTTKGATAISLAKLDLLEVKTGSAIKNGTDATPGKNSTLHQLNARGDCRTISVVAGDLCGPLAKRCGISQKDLEKYNPKKNFCNNLQADQRVCCSAGTLPDIRPKPNKDGSCHVQFVAMGDNCSKYSAKYGLSIKEIDGFNNKKTWGWTGCKDMLAGINICLSKGDPPMPASISNAVCGPTKPGSKRPTDGTKLEDINPCPLNACCNIWGQCGITADFCTVKKGPTGNPGTSAPGFDGCVSSCGQDIVNHSETSKSFGRVGYYESWNFDRSCLNLRAGNGNTDGTYTIIHWAFANINTASWTVSINDSWSQWETFKSMPNVKKVISFGGWGFSTEPATYDILRKAMNPENRNTFATNVASFLEKEKLDGVDFDWEYPGATDIDGTPPGQESDGPNYLKFLVTMKSKLPKGKTLSIAAPASYWYLKAFPIKKMAEQLDYIVYMTYDLHGQWDAGNKWASEGCPGGNCLRSHVNLTETRSVLAMITKAGVKTNQIFVGESSYGRSFKMAKAGCTGPKCTFLGDRYHSQAKKGKCTDTAGYISNAEIQEIIENGDNVKTFYDEDSGSDILVYDNTEWVAYLAPITKDSRRNIWPVFNFRGTIDWAVDLQEFTGDDAFPLGEPTGDQGEDKIPDCKGDYTSLDDVPTDVEPYCKNLYILQALRAEIKGDLDQYNDLLDDGYEKKFHTYAKAVARSGNKALEGFMWDHADDYFTCNVIEVAICCKACEYPGPVDDEVKKRCMYCEGGCGDWKPGCANGPHPMCGELDRKVKNITGPCPPDYSKRTDGPMQYDYDWAHSSVYWSFKNDKKKGEFYAEVLSSVGIEDDNIQFKDVERRQCLPPSTPKEECLRENHDFNFPRTKDYTEDDVKNPEDVVKNSYKNITGTIPQLDTIIDQAKEKKYHGSLYDVVDVVSLMAQMVHDAVDAMQQIEDTVDKWDEEKRKNFIIAFLTAIFLFIPFVGEVVGAIAELANIARIAALAGAVGNAALDVYSIVDDPDNAALAIFSLVLEPLGLLDIAKVSKAASKRRGMSAADLKKLHAKPDSKVHKIDDIRNSCGKKKRSIASELPIGAFPMSDANSDMSGVAIWPEN